MEGQTKIAFGSERNRTPYLVEIGELPNRTGDPIWEIAHFVATWNAINGNGYGLARIFAFGNRSR